LTLHIAIEATCWHNRRGYGRHAKSLFAELVAEAPSHEFTFVTDGDPAEIQMPRAVDVQVVRNSVRSRDALSAERRRPLGTIRRMARALSDSRFDAVIFPSIFSYVPVFSRAAKIVFQHDVIAETFPEMTTPTFASRVFWRMKCAAARWQADRVVTVSEYSRAKIARRLGWPLSRVSVVGEAPAPLFRRLPNARLNARLRRLAIDWSQPVAVFVGGFSPHKNLLRLVEAFSRLQGIQLVMAGETQNETFFSCLDEVRQACARRGVAERVVFTGYMADEDLVVLLNRAAVLVLPSLMEGFGLPAVEAAACGCPVIATRESPLAGLLGDGGLYIDPLSVDELEGALREVLKDECLRARMRDAGLAACRGLSWKAHARTLLGIIEEAVPRRREAAKVSNADRRSAKSWARI
jgi:glycosyltransferase involved in cell wall biosynthesis